MKAILQSIIVALFVLAMSLTVKADEVFYTGNQLTKLCDDELASAAMCAGLIVGFTDGYRSAAKDSGRKTLYCPPKQVINEQIIKIVDKYLKENPESLHEWYGLLINKALIEAFPCEETESSVK
jgi:hypothetical protein